MNKKIRHILSVSDFNGFIDLSNDCFVFVLFARSCCQPCSAMKGTLEACAYKPPVFILDVDCDEMPDLCKKYFISGVPTLISFAYGKPRNTYIGGNNVRDLTNFISSEMRP